MKRIALILAVALVLAGCSGPGPAPESIPTTSPAPTPTIDRGPVLLTDEEAAERYLQVVCQPNAGLNAIDDAIVAGEPEWLNGGSPDPAAVRAAAAETLRVVRLAVEVIDDDYIVWPESVATHVDHIRDSYIQELAVLSGVANADRFEDAYYAQWPQRTPEQAAAGQEIRYQLGLDADTAASCEGYEESLEVVHTEMIDRIAYLATFDEATE
jgi:hypothetical protein